jgi:hypothetical protein
VARDSLGATSSGEFVFLGGGHSATGPSNQVDICNVTSSSWTTATVSVARQDLAVLPQQISFSLLEVGTVTLIHQHFTITRTFSAHQIVGAL